MYSMEVTSICNFWYDRPLDSHRQVLQNLKFQKSETEPARFVKVCVDTKGQSWTRLDPFRMTSVKECVCGRLRIQGCQIFLWSQHTKMWKNTKIGHKIYHIDMCGVFTLGSFYEHHRRCPRCWETVFKS
jgi:hypothetical protein